MCHFWRRIETGSGVLRTMPTSARIQTSAVSVRGHLEYSIHVNNRGEHYKIKVAPVLRNGSLPLRTRPNLTNM